MIKETYIKGETAKGYTIKYRFQVELVKEYSDKKAQGEYVRPSKGILPKVITKRDATDFTIYHEALHACFDFFRETQEIDFTELFDKSNIFGEEAFIHYYEAFYKAIYDTLKGRK